MRIRNRWRAGLWLFLIIILTVSSVAVTVVSDLINQYRRYLLMMAPAGCPRYRTDTILGIEAAQRPLTIADQEIIRTLKAELNANPSPERRRTIEAELKRIYEETTSRAGTDEVTKHR